jgi:aspartate kinase
MISYDEMLELASLGAGVMHSRSIEFAKKFHVPLQVRSSFSDVEGTWIVPENAWMQAAPVCGAAIVRDEARVSIKGVPDVPGVSHRVFAAIADKNIVVDMIVQNVGTGGKADIGFTVLKNELPATLAVLRPLAGELGASVSHEENVSKVSIVGVGMKTHTGVAERLFAALAGENVNIKMITTSEIKVSVLVDRADGARALRAIHQAFRLHELREADHSRQADVPVPAAASAGILVAAGHELTASLAAMEDIVVSDVVLDTSQGRITIYALPDRPGNCSKVFSAIAKAAIVVDMIVQNVNGSETAELSFSVARADLPRALELTRQTMQNINPASQVAADAEIAKVSVLGVGMRTHTGVARRMFGALAERGINISMISTSEIRVGVVVHLDHGQEALTCLRQAFNV